MVDEGSSGDIVESTLSQNVYVLIWAIASLVSFAIIRGILLIAHPSRIMGRQFHAPLCAE
tara:strand:- start:872 stop:1051 length:180 start_codon:yes stop_codon:yes gene_type:complete